jgi:polar amino acid transport system substrate-binding protein
MNRRGWTWTAGLFVAAAALGWYLHHRHAALADQDDVTEPLICAGDPEGGAPYLSIDPNKADSYVGFEVDIANALARELGRPIKYKKYEFNSIFSGLARGDFDIAMNGLEITPDRMQRVVFSRPYYIYKLQLVCRADENRFQTLDDCVGIKDLVIGTLDDTAASRLLDRKGITKRIYSGQVEPYSDCALKRIDAVLLDWPIAVYCGTDPRLKFVGPAIEPGYYAVAFAPTRDKLKPAFDQAFERLIKSGELQQIYEKWRIWTDDQKELASDNFRIMAGDSSVWTFRAYFPRLLAASWVTIEITLTSMALAVVVGLVVALARLYGPPPVRWLGLIYVEFFRGIPVLLLLYFLYYGLPVVATQLGLGVSLNLSPLQAAILGLGLNYAAYESEIYRAGITALPIGQWEAAASLGMSPPLAFRRIIAPQAVRLVLPPMTNDFVALFKDTSVVSIIAVVELSKEYQILSKSSFKYLEIGLTTAGLYLLMSVPLGYLSRYLEKRWLNGG